MRRYDEDAPGFEKFRRRREFTRVQAYKMCGRKVAYENQTAARAARRKCEADRGRRLKHYLCPICNKWHLAKAK